MIGPERQLEPIARTIVEKCVVYARLGGRDLDWFMDFIYPVIKAGGTIGANDAIVATCQAVDAYKSGACEDVLVATAVRAVSELDFLLRKTVVCRLIGPRSMN